jgi:heterotetrameric sarcosine oxidase alpha subunit
MSRQPNRLSNGGLIDRSKPLLFRFDGKSYQGFAGDTVASALLANGESLFGRSFKYHRPRGVLSAGPEEPNALVELRSGARREPNTRATVAELFDGLDARSQNRWPSLRFDAMAINQLFAPIFAAGFYYKTFMWPAALWEWLYEPTIRRAAGLGRAANAEDPDHYEKAFAHCDVLVIGSGPAGLMAALAAGRSGARVILAEEDFRLGGRLIADRREVDGMPSAEWVDRIVAKLEEMPDVRIMRRTSVFGVYDGGVYGAIEKVNDHVAVPPEFEPRQRMWRIMTKQTILAAGSIERPVVFGDNDRPGVMMAGAVRTYVNRYAVAPGTRAAVFANNDDAARTIGDLNRAGVHIDSIIDPRPGSSDAVRKAAHAAGVEVIEGAVERAHGGQRVQSVDIRSNGSTRSLSVDLLAMSGGWSPTVHLTSHHGARPVWNETLSAFVPGQGLPKGMAVAGAAAGHFALSECLSAGTAAGLEAASQCGFHRAQIEIPRADAESTGVSPLWRVRGTKGKAFVDYQNDVSASDVELAEREGFRSVEHLKRYTTLGMATDQGKTANVNGLALMAEITEKSISQTGTTIFRPPYTPVAIGALAGHHRGEHFKPTRLTAGHAWAARQGAVFVESGVWMRAAYFPRPGEKDWLESTIREVNTVRNAVGVCDVSTLGKIDVQGRDAGKFLDFVYCNTFSTLAVGKARYGVMLREDGFAMDDGTTSRLADDHFVVTTTTANAAKVMQHMEFCHQALLPHLDVQMISISDQWAQYAVAGPKSRAVLQKVVDARHDISNEAFPFMAAGELTLKGGIPARLFRISFSGEMAYELAVPANYGEAAIEMIIAAGQEFGIAPYGLEALSVMRIEKGHVAGAEFNGQTTARDFGLGKMVSTKKEFIGRAMALREALNEAERPILVGLKPVESGFRLRSGAHILNRGAEPSLDNDQGYVTSTTYSPTLKSWIGLAFMKNGRERTGEIVRAWDAIRGTDALMEVVGPCFYDPKGERHHG